MSFQNKKNMINFQIKGLYKTSSQFSFSHDCCIFSFPIRGFVNFEILTIFRWQAFITYKNGQNLKIKTNINLPKINSF